MKILSSLRIASKRLGPLGAIGLVCRKVAKQNRYRAMLRDVPKSAARATLFPISWQIDGNAIKDSSATEKANDLLLNRNRIFSWDHELWSTNQTWEYDPIEKKQWPHRHYTEKHLHAADMPRDVKIVWEINRFVELPALGQAACITRDEAYAREVEKRLLSWIEQNPFANTINWASALEISIRLLSWTATLAMLREAGCALDANPLIARSIFEQAAYLAADLSTDKVVPTNHLIGEAAGLFVVSSMWDFPASNEYANRARAILECEIIRQTYSDGVTREASSWYHQFVTDLFDLAERVSTRSGHPMSELYRTRLARMKTYVAALTVNGSLVRYGDADDGLAIDLGENWKSSIFGPATTTATPESGLFPVSRHAALHVGASFVFVRAGEFGMGGDGFSSHAHDDFLSPIVFLDGLPVLADPGTFVYNGNRDGRAKYRGANAHNGLVIAGETGAVQKLNFGWQRVRPDAIILESSKSEDAAMVIGRFGEWPDHTRRIDLTRTGLDIADTFESTPGLTCEWRFHLDPIWKHRSKTENGFDFETNDGDRLEVVVSGQYDSASVEAYDYSPSYGVELQAMMLRLSTLNPHGAYAVQMIVERAA